MLVMKIVYKVERSGEEFTGNIVGHNPEQVARWLALHHGVESLDYYSCQRREEVHLLMPEIEHACFLKVKKQEE